MYNLLYKLYHKKIFPAKNGKDFYIIQNTDKLDYGKTQPAVIVPPGPIVFKPAAKPPAPSSR